MRLIKIIALLLLVLALAVVLNNNSDQQVTIWLLPGTVLEDINLAVALVCTLGSGIILGFGVALIQIMTQQRELRLQNRQLKKLRTELNNLRHSALEGDLSEGEGEGAVAATASVPMLEGRPARQES